MTVAGIWGIYSMMNLYITNGQRDSGLTACNKFVNMSSGMIRNAIAKPNSKLTRAVSRVFIVLVIMALRNEILKLKK